MSASRSASTGTPYLNPKLTTVIRSLTASGVPNALATLSLSWWTLSGVVSMTRSASPRRLGHHLPAPVDALEQPAGALQRVRPPGSLLAPDQDVVVGLEVEQRRTPGRELRRQLLAQRVEEDARAHVDDGRDRLVDALLLVDQAHHVADQLGRQVVDHEVAEVLELLGRRAAAGTGHAGDHDQLALALPDSLGRSRPSVLLRSRRSRC